MYFLLDRADYDSIWPFLTNALWPYTAPHPGKAGDEYVRKLEALVRGELKFNVHSYDADSVTGSIRRLKFEAIFTTPDRFVLDPLLKPTPAACPVFSF